MPLPFVTHKQDSAYTSPWSFGQRVRQLLWTLAWALVCSWTPKPLNPWRLLVLRLFGARIEGTPFVHGSARIQQPWNLHLCHRACLGECSIAYSLAAIHIGEGATVSQEAYLCTGTHDFAGYGLSLRTAPIDIGPGAFVSARAFILPGVIIGARAIVGANSTVTKDVPPNDIVAGSPARSIGTRPD